MKVLVDLDMPCHEIGHIRVETGEYDENGLPIKKLLPFRDMVKLAKGRLMSIIIGSEAGGYKGYVTKGRNYRHKMATILPYKGHRDDLERHRVDDIKDMYIQDYNVEVCTKWEADDGMTMEQWADLDYICFEELDGKWDDDYIRERANTVIASRDKDLDTVPGWRFRWWLKSTAKDAKGQPLHPDYIKVEKGEVYWVTWVEALRNFYKQFILGDTSDNIHGLFGKGEKSTWVTDIDEMETEEEMHQHVLDKYTKYYRNYGRDFMRENGILLHMKRTPGDVWAPYDER